MAVIIMGLGVISIFVVVFLVDISVNLRRVNGNIVKLLKKYENVHGITKA